MSGNRFSLVLHHIRRLVSAEPVPLSDQNLLQRFVRNREEAAFAELMRRHGGMVFGVCRRVLSHSQDAEDACQATFLVLARRAGSVRGSVGGWLHGVAWRVACRLRTQRARRPAQDLGSVDATQPDGTAEVTWREVRLVLDEELQRLPEKYRAPLVLCYLEGMTQDEAARRLGWPCGVLRGRLDRGRERLRSRLARRGLGLSAALFGAGLTESAFAGAVPATVATGLVQGALLSAAGQAAAPAAVSERVVVLAGEVTRTMIAIKLRSAALALATLVLVVVGASYSLFRWMANDPAAAADPPVAVAQAEEKPKRAAAQEGAPVDAVGDVSRARIDGIVVDEAGKPVAGAVVATIRTRSTPATRTAADGSFRLALEAASARYHVVTASADDGAKQGIGSFRDVVLSQVAKLRIVVKPAATINVRVTDAAKKPVKDAAVGVMDSSCFLLTQAQTDAGGGATLRFPADARVQHVVALKPGVGFDYYENYRASAGTVLGPPPPQVTLTLDGARSVVVEAVDSANQPLAGIELAPITIKKKGKIRSINISGTGDLKYASARTKEDGRAVFDWIPSLWLDNISFLNSNYEEFDLPVWPRLKPSDPERPLVARLMRNVPISGKVTLPDGKPAAGILLEAEGRGATSKYFRGVVRTDADGNYKLLVNQNQSYIIAVTDSEWAAPSRTGVVIRDEPRKDVDFRLDRGCLLRGKVTFGPKEKPAARQSITLIEQGKSLNDVPAYPHENLVRSAETGDEGKYEFRIGPGRYELMGPLNGGNFRKQEITLKANETLIRDFHVDRLNFRVLKGVVLAEAFDGKPVGGARLAWNVFQQGVADGQGRFEFEFIEVAAIGPMFLYASNPEGTLAMINRIGDDDEVKVVISAAGKLRGRLVDKKGQPVARVKTQCTMMIGPNNNPDAQAILFGQTDDAGRFEFPGIVAGSRCTVYAYGPEARTVRELPLVQAETVELGDLTFDPDSDLK